MSVLAIPPFRMVDAMVISLFFWDATLSRSHRNNGVARLFEELFADVYVLPGEGLVNKKDIHVLAVNLQGSSVLWSG